MRSSRWMLVPIVLVIAACQREGTDADAVGDQEVTAGDTVGRIEAADDDVARVDAGGPEHDPPDTDEEMIENAESAAPEAVARDASIVAVDAQGSMRTLREGSGTFTCMPDNPNSPGNDPMCLDTAGLEWAQAWMGKQPPPEGKVGFGYMLQGGSDASNTDPYATEPAGGEDWIDTGPHVMVFNATTMMTGYPDQAGDPSKPYVMWPGTPYAHLMIPVE